MPSLLFEQLCSGMYAIKTMNHNRVRGYKTYTGNMICHTFHKECEMRKISHVVKVDKKSRWVISKISIIKLHGNDKMKQYYKQTRISFSKKSIQYS